MNPVQPHPVPASSRLEKEEPEMAQEDDIPTDDKKDDGDRWASGESADDGEKQ